MAKFLLQKILQLKHTDVWLLEVGDGVGRGILITRH